MGLLRRWLGKDDNSGSQLQDDLDDAFTRHAARFERYPWIDEQERWAELAMSLLHQCRGGDFDACARATATLQYLGLLDVRRLAAMGSPASEDGVVLRAVLHRHGFSAEETARAAAVLPRAASFLVEAHDGKVQRFLRAHGEAMIASLAGQLRGHGLDDAALREAVAFWLQNAAAMPVSLETPAVRRFCDARGATLKDLADAADALDVNLALVDDLLAVDEDARQDADGKAVPVTRTA